MDPTSALAYLGDWLHLVIRLAHIVAAIAWVGASFYFVALDRSLRPPADTSSGVGGEAWEIHGGGFYRIEKFRLAPATLPERLTWFKWEAYLTWLTGFALLVLLYYVGANTYLIDPLVRPLEAWQAIGASLAILAIGWVAYDQLARRVGDQRALAVLLCLLVAAVAWGSSQLFSARAAYIQTGAVIGTWMAANVLFVIIPGHRRLVAAMAGGRMPDATDATSGRRRSMHNSYLTLPAVFAMISQHFPFTYGSEQRWLVLVALMGCGVLAQRALNARHDGRSAAPALAGAFGLLALVAIGVAPLQVTGGAMTAAEFPAVQAVVMQRCVACHSVAPTFPGTTVAPKGVLFDTPRQMQAESRRIYQMVVVSRIMPLANVTAMTQEERELIGRWVRSGAPIP